MTSGADQPIVIVGAGPVGLTAAVEFARRDVPVRVVAEGTGPSTTSKAIGTHPRTLEALQRSGVTDRLVALGLPIRRFRLHDQSRVLGELSLAEVPSAYPYALSLGQDATERVLLDRLREAGVQVQWGTRLQSLHQDPGAREVQLTLEHRPGNPSRGDREQVTAPWVIGCDGASSTVRRQAGIAFEGEAFPEWFLVADLHIDGDLGEQRANLYLSDAGATAVFPLPEPGAFRLATPLPVDAATDPHHAPVVEPEDIQALWATRVGRAAQLRDPRWISPFRFQIRLASQYRKGRVLLAGDAAHVHSPVGGQGMNTGIQDAVNLAWKLAAVRRGAPEALLDTYQRERRPVAARVLQQTRRNAVMVSSTSPAARIGRTVGLRLITRTAPLRRRVLSELTMLSVSYPPTALPGSPAGPTVGERITGAPTVGRRAPDAPVVSDGQPRQLTQLCGPHGHTLVYFDAGQATDDRLTGLAHAKESDVTVLVVRRLPNPPPVDGETAGRVADLNDFDGRAHRTYAAGRPLAVLVRPDVVIAWRGPVTPTGRTRLRAVLDAMLPTGAR